MNKFKCPRINCYWNDQGICDYDKIVRNFDKFADEPHCSYEYK